MSQHKSTIRFPFQALMQVAPEDWTQHCQPPMNYKVSIHLYYNAFYYSQLSPRRTPLGPALSVRLIESQIKGINKGRDQLQVSVLQRCPLRESRLYRYTVKIFFKSQVQLNKILFLPITIRSLVNFHLGLRILLQFQRTPS